MWRIWVTLFIALMMASLIPLVFPGILNPVGTVLCPQGTQASTDREGYTYRREVGFVLVMRCMDGDEEVQRVDTLLMFVGGVVMFIIPAFISLKLFEAWAFSTPPKPKSETSSALKVEPMRRIEPMNLQPPAADDSLAEKLRELSAAQAAGLITQDEFDRKRREILERF